jgi:hypothetical protein
VIQIADFVLPLIHKAGNFIVILGSALVTLCEKIELPAYHIPILANTYSHVGFDTEIGA